jgi:hypothetical protein
MERKSQDAGSKPTAGISESLAYALTLEAKTDSIEAGH